MPVHTDDQQLVIAASPEDREAIGEVKEALAVPSSGPLPCGALRAPDGREIPLPGPLFRVLVEAAASLVAGFQVIVAPVHQQLSTQDAADLLNVSRTYLVRVLDRGDIPFEKVGRHRRVRFGDVMAYKKARMEQRKEALRNLVRESEELGLYDSAEKP